MGVYVFPYGTPNMVVLWWFFLWFPFSTHQKTGTEPRKKKTQSAQLTQLLLVFAPQDAVGLSQVLGPRGPVLRLRPTETARNARAPTARLPTKKKALVCDIQLKIVSWLKRVGHQLALRRSWDVMLGCEE